jgi:hypothetical protein
MRDYTDPGGRFSMTVPVGWRTQIVQGGFISLYKDHPEEGIAYIVQPWGDLTGMYSGNQMVSLLVGTLRKRYPDLTIVGQDVRTLERVSNIIRIDQAVLELQWTNLRGERMRGRIAIVVGAAQQVGKSIFHYWAYQAPEVAWDSMQDTFVRMHQSYTGRALVTQPP